MGKFDVAWLDKKNIRRLLENVSWYFDDEVLEDETLLRLKKEIINWLQLPIVNKRENAGVIFSKQSINKSMNEAYKIEKLKKTEQFLITGETNIALLYGFYGFLRSIQYDDKEYPIISVPSQSLRMVNQWDQTDGSVERGYAGASIFFGDINKLGNIDLGSFDVQEESIDPFRHDISRVEFYARMLASVGINAIVLNNCNVRGLGIKLIVESYLDGVAKISQIFSEFGIKIFLSINWAAPKYLSSLKTTDPLDKSVQEFWKKICDDIYEKVPKFGGFLVKADSEGEPGPYQYGRNHAQGANMLASAIQPHGGLIIWRAFVYDSRQDWRDRSTDRAKASYENFIDLDGQFDDNVVLQIKFGPIDFQTSEPITPLFGKLKNTNQLIEFQITAEYLGHQIDVNYVVPQWLKMINFDTKNQYNGSTALVKDVIKENSKNYVNSGFAGVSNVGMDANWTGNKLAQANLYGFGRMCWDNEVSSDCILKEWISLTFNRTTLKSQKSIFKILATSNNTYKKYTAPLGVGFMVVPHFHYGVSVNGYEYDKWGTYHFADRNGVGVDRTLSTGTGFTGLYSDAVSAMFDNIQTVPEDLTLFFHHVAYSKKLSNGKTLIQTIYDNHFEGYDTVQKYIDIWRNLKGTIDKDTFDNVSVCLNKQQENALEWRDQINTYFYRMSGISDELGRTIYR